MVFIFPDFIFQISLPKVSLGKQNMESFHVFFWCNVLQCTRAHAKFYLTKTQNRNWGLNQF